MPDASFLSFLAQVKSDKEQFPVIILYGFNEFLGDRIVQALSKSFLEEKTEFNFLRHYFDSEYAETGWEEIVSEANSSSFFLQSRKIVLVTIRDEKKITLKKYDKELIGNYLKKPNPNTILIIYFSLNVTKDDFKQVKRGKIDKFLKEVSSPNSYKVDLDKISEIEFKRFITSQLKDNGMSITQSALDRIIDIKEEDYISVLHQIPKLLIADVENNSIDSEDINKIITGVEAHSIWDLTDAIETENNEKYLKILKYLFMNGIKATLIIGTLVTHYNKIFIAKFLLRSNYPVEEIGRALGQHRYFLNKFISTTRSFSDKRLMDILRIIHNLDYESKTRGEESSKLSLENFTFQTKLAASKG